MGGCWRPTWTTLRMRSLFRRTSATGARASTTHSTTRPRRAAACACARGWRGVLATRHSVVCCSQGAVHQSIEWLDKLGMNAIEQARPTRSLRVSYHRAGSIKCATLWFAITQGSPPASFIAKLLWFAAHTQGSPQAFSEYLRQYGNTICGRYPIGLFLNARPGSRLRDACAMHAVTDDLRRLQMLEACRTRHAVKFMVYDQSSRCTTLRDSSVSYAAAVVTAAPHVSQEV